MKFQTKVKKSISLLLSLLMIIGVFTVLPFTAGAVNTDVNTTSERYGDFEYDILDDGTAEITGYHGNITEPVIPNSLNHYTVTSIGDDAFWDCTNLESITIPDSVKSIGNYAFDGCESLKNITIPDSVKSIGEDVFYNCTSLTNIEVNEKNKSYSSLNGNLYNKDKTKLIQYAIGKTDASFTIPDSVTSISNRAFRYCASLTNVTIPDSVTSIGHGAFQMCTILTSITIPDSVTSVGDSAFEHCTSITSVTIPSSVKEIGEYAFGYYYDGDLKVENFTIMGYSGTEAENYANANGFKFISLGEAPTTESASTTPSESTNPTENTTATEPTETTPAKTTVTLKKSSATIYVKATAQIKATVKNGKGKTTYKTSNKKVVKVNSSGKVTGVKKGTATITVTNNGVSKKFKITVKNPKLNKSKLTLKKEKSFKLSIKGKVGKAKFTSSNKKVATVSKKGNIKAKKKGKATITVKTNGIKLKCKITVR